MNNAPNFGQQQELTPEQKVKAWYDVNEQLAALKETERRLRKVAYAAIFTAPREGTNTHTFPNNIKFKAQYNTKRKFTVPLGVDIPRSNPDAEPGVNEAVDHMVERLRRASNEGAFIAERLVKWKPEISNSEYKELPENLRKIVDEYIITDYEFASPKVEFPKA